MNPTFALPRGARDRGDGSRPASGGDRPRCFAYLAVGVAALITGFLLGLLCAQGPFDPRSAPQDSLPHPRSIQR